jgi:hypothetical protein
LAFAIENGVLGNCESDTLGRERELDGKDIRATFRRAKKFVAAVAGASIGQGTTVWQAVADVSSAAPEYRKVGSELWRVKM